MAPKSQVTHEQAHEMWESMESPSARKVGARLGVSHTQILAWKANGWSTKPLPDAERLAAANKVKKRVQRVAEDTREAAKELGLKPAIDDTYTRTRAEVAIDKHIIETQRKIHETVQLICHEVGCRRAELLQEPQKLGALLTGLSKVTETLTFSVDEMVNMGERAKKLDRPADQHEAEPGEQPSPPDTPDPMAHVHDRFKHLLAPHHNGSTQ